MVLCPSSAKLWKEEPETWATLTKRAMGEVYDWNRSARIYLEVCKKDLK